MRTSPRTSRLAAAIAAAGIALASLSSVAGPAPTAYTAHATAMHTSIIVRATDGDLRTALNAVEEVDATADRLLAVIDAVSTTVSTEQLHALNANDAVSVTLDAALELHTTTDTAAPAVSLDTVRAHIDAIPFKNHGIDGSGIDIALIDSGITPVVGMDDPSQVVNGPDLSFESGSESLRYLDTYGHGTHMAGIINATPDATGSGGIAEGARIVSLKVADATGATDVSQVIAAIDWVIEHKTSNGLNIRIINLAFGTDGVQAYTLDPLAAAAEAAQAAGLVVVVAGGNSGETQVGLNNPAYDPFVIAVGAADTGTMVNTSDDTVPDWSSKGDGVRNPDVAAPGTSIVSLRVPGSYIDANYGSTAVHGQYGFKGSGTSQAAAVTSGMVALLLQDNPSLTPDQVKYGLREGARDITSAPSTEDGEGLIGAVDARRKAKHVSEANAAQNHATSSGTGSIDASRGTHRVWYQDDAGHWHEIAGETTVFGVDWTHDLFSGASWSGGSWSGGSWSGGSWSGGSWSGGSWSGGSWSGASWSGGSWSGGSWSGASWSGGSWSSSIWG